MLLCPNQSRDCEPTSEKNDGTSTGGSGLITPHDPFFEVCPAAPRVISGNVERCHLAIIYTTVVARRVVSRPQSID